VRRVQDPVLELYEVGQQPLTRTHLDHRPTEFGYRLFWVQSHAKAGLRNVQLNVPYTGVVTLAKEVDEQRLVRGFHGPYRWLPEEAGVDEPLSHCAASACP